jgi:hypothetical protein
VNNYFSQMKKIDSFKFQYSLPNYKCGNLIRDTDVQNMEYIIFILLNRMYDHRIKILPKKENILENKNLDEDIIKLFQKDYVQTICKHIQRCLDFIYICERTFINLGKIFSLYTDICYSLNKYVLKYNDKN